MGTGEKFVLLMIAGKRGYSLEGFYQEGRPIFLFFQARLFWHYFARCLEQGEWKE
jgi:hypothetical protein